ncbi:hypothetical protein BDQ17DRAFT_1357142, partial [Cyathus striatus]
VGLALAGRPLAGRYLSPSMDTANGEEANLHLGSSRLPQHERVILASSLFVFKFREPA